MDAIYLKKMETFACIASACTSTCCSGWNILVDEQSVMRYKNLTNPSLRYDILNHLRIRNGNYYFQNRPNGDCAMLDSDGLCRIQKNTDEKTLCHTCRKYPRLVGKLDDGRSCYFLAASCPVVAKSLILEPVKWVSVSNGVYRDLSIRNDSELQLVREALVEIKNWRISLESESLLQIRKTQYQMMLCMAEKVAECVKHYPECSEILDILESYVSLNEKQGIEKLNEFYEFHGDTWNFITNNYLKYRIVALKAEEQMEAKEEVFQRVFGELQLLLLFMYGMMEQGVCLSEEQWIRGICLNYRFTAHGNKRKLEVKHIIEQCATSKIM